MGLFGRNRPIFDSTAEVHFTNTYHLEGKSVTCMHCGGQEFDRGSALLNTPGMTFFGLDWANRTATILSCRRCGRIEWFARAPEEIR